MKNLDTTRVAHGCCPQTVLSNTSAFSPAFSHLDKADQLAEVKELLLYKLQHVHTVKQLSGLCPMALLYEALTDLIDDEMVSEVVDGHYRAVTLSVARRILRSLSTRGAHTINELEIECDINRNTAGHAIRRLQRNDQVVCVGKRADKFTGKKSNVYECAQGLTLEQRYKRRKYPDTRRQIIKFLYRNGPSTVRQIALDAGISIGHTNRLVNELVSKNEVGMIGLKPRTSQDDGRRLPKLYALRSQAENFRRPKVAHARDIVKRYLDSPRTAQQIADKTGMAQTRIYQILNELVARGEIKPAGKVVTGSRKSGSKAMRYRLTKLRTA